MINQKLKPLPLKRKRNSAMGNRGLKIAALEKRKAGKKTHTGADFHICLWFRIAAKLKRSESPHSCTSDAAEILNES